MASWPRELCNPNPLPAAPSGPALVHSNQSVGTSFHPPIRSSVCSCSSWIPSTATLLGSLLPTHPTITDPTQHPPSHNSRTYRPSTFESSNESEQIHLFNAFSEGTPFHSHSSPSQPPLIPPHSPLPPPYPCPSQRLNAPFICEPSFPCRMQVPGSAFNPSATYIFQLPRERRLKASAIPSSNTCLILPQPHTFLRSGQLPPPSFLSADWEGTPRNLLDPSTCIPENPVAILSGGRPPSFPNSVTLEPKSDNKIWPKP